MLFRHPSRAGATAHARTLRALVSALVTLSCAGSEPTGPDPVVPPVSPVASLALSADTATLTPGATTTLAVTVRDAAGATLSGIAVAWASSDTLVARVAAGTVTGVGGGTSLITASANGKTATATITVRVPVAAVSVTPDSGATIAPGVERTLVAVARDAAGVALAGRTFAWTSSDTAVATVSATGVVRARFDGAATITATSEGRVGTARIHVRANVGSVVVAPDTTTLASGAARALAATVKDSTGRALAGRALAWSSSDPAVAAVDSTGRVTAGVLGRATITATSEGRGGAANIVVTSVPVASVAFAAPAVTMRLGELKQIVALARDSAGASLPDRPLAWRSSDSTIALVDDGGNVVGRRLGTATLTATAEGRSASATVTVAPIPLATVDLSPDTLVLTLGDSARVTAIGRDSLGRVDETQVVVSYDVADRAVAGVLGAATASPAWVKGLALGTTTLRATIAGRTAQSVVRVVPQTPVASITFSTTSLTVAEGDSTHFWVTLRDSTGAELHDVRRVTWSSTNITVANAGTFAGPGGTFTGHSSVGGGTQGTVTVTVTVDGRSASLPVTVGPPQRVAVLRFAARRVDIQKDLMSIVDLTMLDARGRPIPSTRAATWSTSDSTIVALRSTVGTAPQWTVGYSFLGKRLGEALIRVQVDGLSDTVRLNVIPTQIAYYDVTPAPVEVQVGATAPLTVSARAVNSQPIPGVVNRFSSFDSTIATVSASGVVTGVKLGTTAVRVETDGYGRNVEVRVVAVGVATVVASPSAMNLSVGLSRQIVATARDGMGATLAGRAFLFRSSNPSVAMADSLIGTVTGVAVGTATITVTSEGKSATVPVAVRSAGPVASVTVEPSPVSVAASRTQALTVTLKDSLGTPLGGRAVTYASSLPGVATVSAAGLVTGVTAGSATLTVTSEGKTASVPVTVTAAPPALARFDPSPASVALAVGATQQVTPRPIDVNGAVATDRTIAWSSANTAVATVSATGLIRAVAVGTTTVVLSSEGKTASIAVTVTSGAGAVASVSIAPNPAEVAMSGGTTTLAATLRDASGAVLAGRAIAWSSSDTSIVVVSATGVVTGRKSGSATVTATSESRAGSATVVSRPPQTVARVAATLGRSELMVGDSLPLLLRAYDASGLEIADAVFEVTNGAPTRIAIGANRMVKGVAAGVASIVVSSGGRSTEAVFNVVDAYTIRAVVVSIADRPASMLVDSTAQLTAWVVGEGDDLPADRFATWTMTVPGIVSLTPLPRDGSQRAHMRARGLAVGTTLVIVRAGTKADTVSLTVSEKPVAMWLDVEPSSLYLKPGDSRTLVPRAYDASGAELIGRTATWTTSDAAIATVDATGLVVARALGSATITARIDGATEQVPVTVQPTITPVASVVVTPATSTIAVGGTVQLRASTRDASNVEVTRRTVTWRSDNTAIATVSASGLVTGRSSGAVIITAESEGVRGTARVTVGTTTSGGGGGACAGVWKLGFGSVGVNQSSAWQTVPGTSLRVQVRAVAAATTGMVRYQVFIENGYTQAIDLSLALLTNAQPTSATDRGTVAARTIQQIAYFTRAPGSVYVYLDKLLVGGRAQCQ